MARDDGVRQKQDFVESRVRDAMLNKSTCLRELCNKLANIHFATAGHGFECQPHQMPGIGPGDMCGKPEFQVP